MKKNIFYSFIVAILLSSCQGMDLMPADKMSDGDYWLTENDFKIYANGLYPSLMKFNGDDNLAQYDQKADLSTSYFGFNSVSNGRWLPSESDGVWDDCYAYLRKIHILLEHVDALHTTDPKILRYKGEALFFRAYQYCIAVKDRFVEVQGRFGCRIRLESTGRPIYKEHISFFVQAEGKAAKKGVTVEGWSIDKSGEKVRPDLAEVENTRGAMNSRSHPPT